MVHYDRLKVCEDEPIKVWNQSNSLEKNNETWDTGEWERSPPCLIGTYCDQELSDIEPNTCQGEDDGPTQEDAGERESPPCNLENNSDPDLGNMEPTEDDDSSQTHGKPMRRSEAPPVKESEDTHEQVPPTTRCKRYPQRSHRLPVRYR